MIHIIKKLAFFAPCLKEAYQKQRIAHYLEKNSKKIAEYKQWEEFQKLLNPNVPSGKIISYSPLVLGYADRPVLYRDEAAEELGKFLNRKIAPEEMVLCGLENNFLNRDLNVAFFTTVWLYQKTYFAELGVSFGKKCSKIGFLDERMFHIEPLQNGCAPRAINISYYGSKFYALPHCSLYYMAEDNDIKPLMLIDYGKGSRKMTKTLETYTKKVSYAEILAAAKKSD